MNRQLAEMLRTGIPLEKGLQRICHEMEAGIWRTELEQLGREMASGKPLVKALEGRQLPQLYRQMLILGAQGNDLPGVLTLLADHYHRRHTVWTRLQGLMVYPTIVLCCSLVLSLGLAVAIGHLGKSLSEVLWDGSVLDLNAVWMYVPAGAIAMALGALVAAFWVRPWREYLRWRLPAFREAALADFAGVMALMLQRGVPVPQALQWYRDMDTDTPLSQELRAWQTRLAAGAGKTGQFAEAGACVPPLFIWLLGIAGEDLGRGFAQAAEVFHTRARHLTEVLLYAALPVMVLFLGTLIVVQLLPAASMITTLLNALGAVSM